MKDTKTGPNIEEVKQQIRQAFAVAKAIREVEQLDFIDLVNLTGFNHAHDCKNVKEAWLAWIHEIMEEDPETGQASPELETLLQYKSWRDAWKHLCRSGRWTAIRDMVDPLGLRKTVVRFPLAGKEHVEKTVSLIERFSTQAKVNRYTLTEAYAQLLAVEMRLRTGVDWLQDVAICQGQIDQAKNQIRAKLEAWGDWQQFAFVFDPNVPDLIRITHPDPCGKLDHHEDSPCTAEIWIE